MNDKLGWTQGMSKTEILIAADFCIFFNLTIPFITFKLILLSQQFLGKPLTAFNTTTIFRALAVESDLFIIDTAQDEASLFKTWVSQRNL